MSTNELTTQMPTISIDDGDNFAEIGTAAWIAQHGGTDVTYQHGESDDFGHWVGDVERDGIVYRLTTTDGDRNSVIRAEVLA